MRLVFLAGGIACGKSTVARLLEELGARRVDLDDISREVTGPGMPATLQLAQAFGPEVLDEQTGALRRTVLAQRAFATSEGTQTLEAIVHPAIRGRLGQVVRTCDDNDVLVVEVPLLDRIEDLLDCADDVVVVICPLPLRRERARLRGMDVDDFDARVRRQTSDEYLIAHATTVLNNEKDEQTLHALVHDWWHGRVSDNK